MADTLVRFTALSASVFPALVILAYFAAAARVRIDAEMLWASFGFGACVAFPVIMVVALFESIVGYPGDFIQSSAMEAFLGAAVPEEIAKFAALWCLCGRQFRSLAPQHLFLFAIAAACGFACLENIFYVVEESGAWGFVAVIRSLSAVPGHAFVGCS